MADKNWVTSPLTLAHLTGLASEPGKADTATAQAMIRDAERALGMLEAAEDALLRHRAKTKAEAEQAARETAFDNAVRDYRRDPGRARFLKMIFAGYEAHRSTELFDFVVETLRPGGLPRDGPFVWCSTETDPTDTIDQEDFKMATHVILTPPGTASFLNLQKPRAIVEGAEPRFSLTLIFDKTAQKRPEFTNLQKGIDEALKERWPGKLPVGLISPFHDGSEKADRYEGYKPGDIFISPWTKSKPGCVNNRREDIIDWSEFYAGWVVRANVRPFAYDTAGKRGCSFFLETVQFLKPGPRLDGRKPADQSFPEDDEGGEEPV